MRFWDILEASPLLKQRPATEGIWKAPADWSKIMPDTNNRDYYIARAIAARKLADNAEQPAIKAIHSRMAKDYEALALDAKPNLFRVVSG